jgi:hypothetical protein
LRERERLPFFGAARGERTEPLIFSARITREKANRSELIALSEDGFDDRRPRAVDVPNPSADSDESDSCGDRADAKCASEF